VTTAIFVDTLNVIVYSITLPFAWGLPADSRQTSFAMTADTTTRWCRPIRIGP